MGLGGLMIKIPNPCGIPHCKCFGDEYEHALIRYNKGRKLVIASAGKNKEINEAFIEAAKETDESLYE